MTGNEEKCKETLMIPSQQQKYILVLSGLCINNLCVNDILSLISHSDPNH